MGISQFLAEKLTVPTMFSLALSITMSFCLTKLSEGPVSFSIVEPYVPIILLFLCGWIISLIVENIKAIFDYFRSWSKK